MNKLNNVIRIVLVLLGTGFFTVILYVSILGENHKIDYLVTRFFEDIKDKNYDIACRLLAQDENDDRFAQKESCMDSCFILELAFLNRYKLMGQNNYVVRIRRDPFWIPFISDDTISVSVALSTPKSNIIEKMFHDMDDKNFISGFMTVSRMDGAWEITSINLKDSDLYPSFIALSQQVDLNRYIQSTDQGFVLKGNTINPSSLSDMDRRLLDYSLFKLTHDQTKH